MTGRPDEATVSIVRDTSHGTGRSLAIGVVNNMPEAAFQATADQFDSLLRLALPDGIALDLRLFRPPGRTDIDPASRRHLSAEDLWTAALDGLIVTGTEPQSADIADEPCLPFLSDIVDWVEAGTVPTIWSCLAAHAAVYRLDGIARRQRDTKLSGVFRCDTLQSHPLLDGAAGAWTIPHSRLNEVSEAALAACGYGIVTRSAEVGVDTFVKQGRASHVFLNGHPEYGQATLCSEYRRDVRRFLRGERACYPAMPTGYFSDDAVARMTAFRELVSGRVEPELMAQFPSVAATTMPWRDTAVGLFRNWLTDVARRKSDRTSRLHSSSSGPAVRSIAQFGCPTS